MLRTMDSLSGTSVTPEKVHARRDSLIFPLGDGKAAVALMPAPIPWSNLEGPCAAAWWWPEATERMRTHASHLLLALTGESGDAVRRALELTHLTAAAIAHVETAGVYWGGGRLVHEPKVFVVQARGAGLDRLPLHLWIDFRVETGDDGTLRLFTTGMQAFGKMEIEIPRSRRTAAELYQFARSIADYILARGAEVRDGHTVGRWEEEKVPATHAPSMWDPTMPVLRLDF